ncbi:radical SAM family heme chaperone HemW [Phycicoccus sp. MAQZ13P-2]|uniref:radical SAM family heme chaperone HemW n=1 Tax=Phycicoccus mangrovi TaxID=2840470 RepID=UPI001C004823|nr:radical SAM family heme chaperone HemW [Phycicoccus mangrovi]MBT9258055.1 radical SAM family heme chaperone HemW [Phycicoccus mangrovi]MBT9276266.1 radical SAM family heme chaperone HemW [Phycicoccus mangrovi]
MPRLPDGDPAPASGELPADAVARLADGRFGLYLHVPFCAVRCGYCDFNTYTLTELGPGASTEDFAGTALAELDLAARVLGDAAPVVDTVFVGGGTPTLLPADDLVRLLDGVRERFGLADGAEVTTEANPDSVTPQGLETLAAGGFTRVSLGMQSAVPSVLATLDRTHDPARVAQAVAAARTAGLATSLDLIYGTPGESLDDWRTSLEAALALEPDHVSAYALVVEEGTRMARQVARGELPEPEGDDEADKYELADTVLAQAGYDWYEVSNWARTPADRCRHNEGYWRGDAWWGIGPGAHGHVGGVRWWNVKHPRAYAARLAAGESPAAAREVLTAEQRHDEEVLLGVRLREGLDLGRLDDAGRTAVAGLVADGLLEGPAAVRDRRAVLTLRGRLLADTVVRRLLGP